MTAADTILAFAQLWGVVGAAIALAFLTIGIDRIDEDAREAYVFRPLLIPAILLIWPLVLWRWWVLETGRDQWARRHRPPRAAHLKVAVVMAVLVPAILITALAQRQDWPADIAPLRLGQPAEVSE